MILIKAVRAFKYMGRGDFVLFIVQREKGTNMMDGIFVVFLLKRIK